METIDPILKKTIGDVIAYSNLSKEFGQESPNDMEKILESTRSIALYALQLRNATDVYKNHGDHSSIVEIVNLIIPLVNKTYSEMNPILNTMYNNDTSKIERSKQDLESKKEKVIENLKEMVSFIRRNKDRPVGQPIKLQKLQDMKPVPKPTEEVVMIPINMQETRFEDSLHEIHELPSTKNTNFYNKDDPISTPTPQPIKIEVVKKQPEPKIVEQRIEPKIEPKPVVVETPKPIVIESPKPKPKPQPISPPVERAKSPPPMSPQTSKKISDLAANVHINLDTFKPGYVHPRFQTGEATSKEIGEPTEMLITRLISLEEKRSDQLGKNIKEMEDEVSKSITFKEFIIKMTGTEPDGLMGIKQMKIQIAELKDQKEDCVQKEDFKGAQRFKMEIDKIESSIDRLTKRLDDIESELKSLQDKEKTILSYDDKEFVKKQIQWRNIMKTWLDKELYGFS